MHNNNVIEQNINVTTFDILSVKQPHIEEYRYFRRLIIRDTRTFCTSASD